jgi:hypothetical protein
MRGLSRVAYGRPTRVSAGRPFPGYVGEVELNVDVRNEEGPTYRAYNLSDGGRDYFGTIRSASRHGGWYAPVTNSTEVFDNSLVKTAEKLFRAYYVRRGFIDKVIVHVR